jgi:anti-anti-sigma factor
MLPNPPNSPDQATLYAEVERLRQRVAELEAALMNSARLTQNDAERYFEVIEITRDGLWDWDITTSYVYYSPRWLSALGYTADEVVYDVSTWESFIHPDDKESVMACLQAHLTGHKDLYEAELRLRMKSGEWRWVLDRGKIVRRSPEGQPLRMIGTFTDITARKQAELALQAQKQSFEELNATLEQRVQQRTSEVIQSQRMLQAILDNAPMVIYVKDLEGKYLFVGQQFNALFGLETGAILGKDDTALLPADEAAQIRRTDQQIMASGRGMTCEEQIRVADTQRLFLSQKFPMYDEQGTVIGLCGIAYDITEQRQQVVEREALQQQLIEAQRHTLRELSTPLIPISERVVIMPLIGAIDSNRAQQVMETLLEGVARHGAELAILDITGVQVVDTQVAQAFIQAAKAVRLLGAQVMLTGIQPQIAQTLVHLGVDLSGIITRASLQAGIADALHNTHERTID